MNSMWLQRLASDGAQIENGIAQNFGDSRSELVAAHSGAVVADLSHLGVLELAGDDSETFLQGQLTCDVSSVDAGTCSYGSFCTPKGRMFASFLLWREANSFRMALARDLVASAQKRLKMYVLRSKVQIREVSDSLVLLGVSGNLGTDAPGALPTEVPAYAVRRPGEDITALSLPGNRLMLAVPAEHAVTLWEKLTARLRPVGTPCWEWLDIQNGIPWVTVRTQEQFLPQMANLELLGGVSFKKGCFTGQEVVARAQHLGKVKRRMFLAHADDSTTPPAAGDEIFSDDIPDQASGMVVNAQAAPRGGYDLLAVVQISSRAASAVHLRSSHGPVLLFGEMPYAVE